MSNLNNIIIGKPKVYFSKNKRRLLLSIAFILFIVGITSRNMYTLIISVIVMITSFYEKRFIVNKEGLKTSYIFLWIHYDEFWSFLEMNTIYIKDVSTEKYALFFLKENIMRDAYFSASDVKSIIQQAKEKNSSISIEYV